MTFKTSLEITNDPNDFVPALKVKEWEESILAGKPSKIKLSSNLQMTVLLKLHRTGKLCYQECLFFGTPVEVSHCGYVYEPHGLGLGMAYSEALMSDMSPPKEYNINGSVEIVISDNPSDCTHENDYKEWLQGIVSESTAVDRPVVVTITEPEQLCMLKSLKGSSGIIIKRIQIGDESVNMTINKDGYCIPEQENDSLEHFSNILIVEQMEAF